MRRSRYRRPRNYWNKKDDINPVFKDNINTLFKKLRKAGYVARQNFLCCQNCAWNALEDEKKMPKVVFYHRQDAECLPDGHVYLAWRGDGNEIKHLAEESGLAVEWDGTEDNRHKIFLPEPTPIEPVAGVPGF